MAVRVSSLQHLVKFVLAFQTIQCWIRRLWRSCSARRGYNRVSSRLCFTGRSTLEGVRIYMPLAHSHYPWRRRLTIHSTYIQPTQTSGLHRTISIHRDLMLVPTLLQPLRARNTRRPSIGCETIGIHAICLPRIANRLSEHRVGEVRARLDAEAVVADGACLAPG